MGCQKRITKHWKMADLAAVKGEKCPSAEEQHLKGGKAPTLTKGETLKPMLAGELPDMAAHKFELQKNYLVCQECKCRILRHAAKEKLVALAATPCWNGIWQGDATWAGHHSHEMWRQGGKLSCRKCKAQAIRNGDGFQPSKNLRAPCGESFHQTRLPTCFRAKKAD